jgi:hypothetical protein
LEIPLFQSKSNEKKKNNNNNNNVLICNHGEKEENKNDFAMNTIKSTFYFLFFPPIYFSNW